jgi:hypothetical protein
VPQSAPGAPIDQAILDEIDRVLAAGGSGPTGGAAARTTGQASPYATAPTVGSSQAAQQAQTAMMDAIASGNREKFDEARRQYDLALAEEKRQFELNRGDARRKLFMDLFGYDPGESGPAPSAPGTTGPPGSYKTVNGIRTVDQMRAELKEASFPNWERADEKEIAEVYARTTGGPVTPAEAAAPGAPPAAPAAAGINQGAGARIKQIYQSVLQRKGVPSVGPTDPMLLSAVASEFGLTPQQAEQVLRAGQNYAVANGTEPPDAIVQAAIDRVKPFGDRPTLPAREFEERNRDDERDFGEGTRRFEKGFDEQARQFDTGQYSDMARSILQASSTMRGPRDYRQYQNMVSGGRDILDQLGGSTPQQGFGMTGTPERARVTDILEQLGLFARPFNAVAAARTTAPTMPTLPLGPMTDVTPREQKRRALV